MAAILAAANLPPTHPIEARRYHHNVPSNYIIPIACPKQYGDLREAREVWEIHAEMTGDVNFFDVVHRTDLMWEPQGLVDVCLALIRYGYRLIWFNWVVIVQGGGTAPQEDTFQGNSNAVLHNAEDVSEHYRVAADNLIHHYLSGESSSTRNIMGVSRIVVHACKHKSIRGRGGVIMRQGCARFVTAIQKRGVLEVEQTNDTCCFKWALLRYYAHEKNVKDGHRVRTLKRINQNDPYRLDHYFGKEMAEGGVNIISPTIAKWEADQQTQISIYMWDEVEEEVMKVRTSRLLGVKKHIALIVLKRGDCYHYAYVAEAKWIFLEKPHNKAWACGRCMRVWQWGLDKEEQEKHNELCCENRVTQKEKFSDKDITFNATSWEMPVPVRIYADFEAIQFPADDAFTTTNTTHRPASFAWYVCADFELPSDHRLPYYSYIGEDAGKHFLCSLIELRKVLRGAYFQAKRKYVDPCLTHEEEDAFEEQEVCERCLEPFAGDKCRHHNHLSGKYIGALCTACNSTIKTPDFYTHVYFHNANYDISLAILHHLNDCNLDDTVYTNSDGVEKVFGVRFIGASVTSMKCLDLVLLSRDRKAADSHNYVIRILDSRNHLMGSLSHYMSRLLQQDRSLCKAMHAMLGDKMHEKENDAYLINGKGLFPYEYFDSLERLQEPLPGREHYNNYLPILQKPTDAEWAKQVSTRTRFGWRTFREEHDHYLLLDVTGLADVFETYREKAMKNYGIDPSWALTRASFAYKVFLRGHFGHERHPITLPSIPDAETFTFLERCKRGGISIVGTEREAWSNHPYDSWYDETKPTRSLIYSDATNLYGYCMTQPLPCTVPMEMVNPWLGLFANESVNYSSVNPHTGLGDYYFFEVDVRYPVELHDHHKDLPFLAEHRETSYDDLSAYSQDVYYCETEGGRYMPGRKLVPSLYDKEHLFVCGDELQQAQAHGLEVTKVHRAFHCHSRKLMEPFVEWHRKARVAARAQGDEVQADDLKLTVNSCYGKTMENMRDRKRFDVLLHGDRASDEFTRIVNRPHFEASVFSMGTHEDGNEIDILRCRKQEVKLDVPLYIGVAILAKAKVKMYSHWYTLKDHYKDELVLHFMDTDSLCFSLMRDWYTEMRNPPIRSILDFKKYDKNEGFEDLDNPLEEQLGYLKDECAPNRLVHVVALKSKMHMEQMTEGGFRGSFNYSRCTQKLKGVPKLVKNQLTPAHWQVHDHGPSLDFTSIETRALTTAQREHVDEAYRPQQRRNNKRTLSTFYDKAMQLDANRCLPFGYKGREEEAYEAAKRAREN